MHKTGASIWGVLVFIWVVLGLVAFVWSITCFWKSGTLEQQWLGLLVAIVTGPFYFLFLNSAHKQGTGYC